MFESIRSSKWFVKIFLFLIAMSFALWGVESYLRDISGGDDVATVGDTKITQSEYAQLVREQQEELSMALGERYTPDMLNTPEARRAMIEQLVNQRLLLIEARQNGMSVGEGLLREIIQSIPSLQDNGQFSMERYESLARSRGYSLAGFEEQLRRDMLMQQVAGSVGESALLSKTAFAGTHGLLAEKRQYAELQFKASAYTTGTKVEDAEISAYYDANAARFEVEEQVRARYVVLSPEAIASQVSVSEAELQAWYDGHRDRYAVPEERRASHVLISVDASASAEARDKALARAEKLLADIRARPADFARLARENSDDPGSAAAGGDLGFFARGAMVPAFEAAAFSLPDGGLSDVVTSDFGYHIIKVTGINPGRERAFLDVRRDIESELREQAVQRKYAEAAEQFANIAYEQSDSLKPLVEKFKLKTEESTWITRRGQADSPSAIFNPKLVSALFSDDVLKDKRNSEAVEIAPSTLVVARVIEHKPAAKRPLDSVKGEIRDILLRTAAAKRAAEAGAKVLADLQAGKPETSQFGKKGEVSRLAVGGLTPAAARAVLDAPVGKLPAYTGVSLGDGTYSVFKILAVDAADAKAEDSGLRDRIAQIQAQQELRAFLESLRERHKVEINPRALEGARS